MIIKLAIIGAVLLAGGVLFSGELAEMFPRSVGSLSSVGEDLSGVRDSMLGGFDEKIDGGIGDVSEKLDEFTEGSVAFVSEKIGEGLPEIEVPQVLAGAQP